MNQKIFLTFQQSELDAVKMYQALAERTGEETMRKALLSLGAVEGRHAAILSKITGVHDLKPTDRMAKLVTGVDRFIGRRPTLVLMAVGEYGASWLYKPLAKAESTLVEVGKQEAEHAAALLRLVRSTFKKAIPAPLQRVQ